MKSLPPRLVLSCLCALSALHLSSCGTLTGLVAEPESDIVYALGSREGFSSPLQSALKPACPALEFAGVRFTLTGAHEKVLTSLAAAWPETKPRYLIVGYAPPGLPEDYARTLSERRAQAVRQRLIESGVEAANLQTVGYGHDSAPSSPNTSVVVIYRQ